MKALIQNISLSIFTKLLLISIVTGGLINFFVIRAAHHLSFPDRGHRQLIDLNFLEYAKFLRKELGSPLRVEKAKEMSLRLGLGFRYERGAESWVTDESLPSSRKLEVESKSGHHPPGPMRFSADGRPFVLVVGREGGVPDTLIVFAPKWSQSTMSADKVLALISILTLIIGSGYLAIRKILTPLRSIAEGVAEVGSGKLDHRISIKGRDELARLADSFNKSTQRIQEMVTAKEQLLLDVSHELRSPLTRMKVFLEFVKDEKPKNQIATEIREMDCMVEDLLESARMDSEYGSLKCHPVALSSLLADLRVKYGEMHSKIRWQGGPDSLFVLGDSDRLKMVFKNIIENALKYSPADSQVDLKVIEETAWVKVRVEDSGRGIPAAELSRIFEPFYRVDKSRSRETGGFGLGLSLSQKIIRAHGGSISITSEVGAGTCVVITLPKAEMRLSA